MPQHPLAKTIYDLAGIVAICSAIVGSINLILYGVITVESLLDSSSREMIVSLLLIGIPMALTVAFPILIALACRRWSQRCGAESGAEGLDKNFCLAPQPIFILSSGVVGMILIILVLYRVLYEAGERAASGLLVDNTAIPFVNFVDLGLYFLLGCLLFFHPSLPYKLWMHLGAGRHTYCQPNPPPP